MTRIGVDVDLMSGPSVTRPFEDLFLLAVIDAHTENGATPFAREKARERRLAAAKTALFGVSAPRGPKTIDDRAALYWMAMQHHRDRALVFAAKMGFGKSAGTSKPRSMRRLAKEAAQHKYGSSDASTIDRLREAFASDSDYWMAMAQSHDDVRETMERQILESLQKTLATVGIGMKLSGAPQSK